MSGERWLPVHPDLDRVKLEADAFLTAIHAGDERAIAELKQFHANAPSPDKTTIEDARLAIAAAYGAPSWERVVQSCELIDAIWEDDSEKIRTMINDHPNLLNENAGIRNVNWGPPLSYASNVGRDEIIEMLHDMGATDLEKGLDRAVLQGRIETAKKIHRLLGSPKPPPGAFGSPAYTLKVNATQFLFDIGAELIDENGNPDAPADVVIESDSRAPEAKHRILEMYVEHGFDLPDTPMMALHRGRIDLLEAHMKRDPGLLSRTFSWDEIYPPALKCQPLKPGSYDEHLPRTPIANSTLLHASIEYDELEIARWLLQKGMNANIRAAVDENGFGGHTPLFNAVVSYPIFWMNFTGGWPGTRKPQNAVFAELLFQFGADANARASFREPVHGGKHRDHINVTPIAWGREFQNRMVVNEPALSVVAEHGGAA